MYSAKKSATTWYGVVDHDGNDISIEEAEKRLEELKYALARDFLFTPEQENAFRAAYCDIADNDDWQSALERLHEKYKDKSKRLYHSTWHIKWLVDELLQCPLEDRSATILAGFYHDAIYVPGAPDNEANSATLALSDLGPSTRTDKVFNMIMATKTHVDPPDNDTAHLIDVDMSALGWDWNEFQRNGEMIKLEIGSLVGFMSYDDEREYFKKRRAFCEAVLAQDRIFYTERYAHLEEKARRNLEMESSQCLSAMFDFDRYQRF